MKRIYLIITLLAAALTSYAEAFSAFGIDSVGSDFFRQWYHQGDLVHYLDNYSDYSVYQSETTGRWDMPDQLIFSVQGNSYRWNRYYIDGFRTDQRFTAGSTMYRPQMLTTSLALDLYRSQLFFTTDTALADYASVTYNIGGLGGVSPGTRQLINLFHHSALERLYVETDISHPDNGKQSGLNPEDYRQRLKSAGELEVQYGIPSRSGHRYVQHAYANFGWRSLTAINQTGVSGSYTDDYYKVQLQGELPFLRQRNVSMHYLLNIASRSAMGYEFYYNPQEVMQNKTYSASLYWKNVKADSRTRWTAGLSWNTNNVRHRDLSFARNLVDQDGEAFEPWMPDGNTHELSLAANLSHRLLSWLTLNYDGYNTMLFFRPEKQTFSNDIYWNSMFSTEQYDLYCIDWQSQPFAAGLLENTLGLEADYEATPWLRIRGNLDVTLDGIVLADNKSIVQPNYQAQLSLYFHPVKWFDANITIGNYRVAFNIEDVRFFSSRYLNGTIRHASDGSLFATTGGQYHRLEKGTWQPSYLVFDIPFRFTIGRHEISMLQSFRKYYNIWFTRFDADVAAYGHYVTATSPDAQPGTQVYVVDPGQKNYVVGYQDKMGDSFITNTPYWGSNVFKYTYNGRKVLFSASWQTYMMASVSAMGNGPIHNNIGMLSESTANPNLEVITVNHSDKPYHRVGRTDQDKSFIARLLFAYNITDSWQLGLTFKFKDGQPFSNFTYQFATDADGYQQAVVWNRDSKGINPTDGHFGKRKDAFFDLDVNLSYKAFFKNDQKLFVQLLGYNLYDFCTGLTEFTFEESGEAHRYAMTLCSPRGLMVNLKYEF